MHSHHQAGDGRYEIPTHVSPAGGGPTATGDRVDLLAGEDWSYLSRVPKPKKMRARSRPRFLLLCALGGVATAAALARFPQSSDDTVDVPPPVRRHAAMSPAAPPEPAAPAAVTNVAVSAPEAAPQPLLPPPSDEAVKPVVTAEPVAAVKVEPVAAVKAPEPPQKPKLVDPGIYRPPGWAGGRARRQTAPARIASADSKPKVSSVAVPPSPWNRLRHGMPKHEVLWLIGPPPWKEKSVSFEFWMYEVNTSLGSGVVVFDSGSVYSWRLPSTVVAAQ